jgi:hypothetical protein
MSSLFRPLSTPAYLTRLISFQIPCSRLRISPFSLLPQTPLPPGRAPHTTVPTSWAGCLLTPTWACALCGQPTFLQPFTGNMEPHDPRIPPGWHPTLSYTTPSGDVESSTVPEVGRWVQDFPLPPSPVPPPLPLLPSLVPPSTQQFSQRKLLLPRQRRLRPLRGCWHHFPFLSLCPHLPAVAVRVSPPKLSQWQQRVRSGSPGLAVDTPPVSPLP